jgi:hypothetical protein
MYRYISLTVAIALATFVWSHDEKWHPARKCAPLALKIKGRQEKKAEGSWA